MAETAQIIAIHSYGSQRVKHPLTHQMVSAYKIGYSSAACETLLTLWDKKARDVSSPHASYYYIQIDGDVTVRHGYLLLKVTSAELGRAEIVTRRYHRAAVYLWRDGKWLELPTNRDCAYTEPSAHSRPNFNPASFRLTSPSTGEKEAAVQDIQVEKSQRSPNEKSWFWLTGDTYPHRETLKRYGARFSGRRKAWYFVGWELPEAIQRLVTEDVPAEPEPPAQVDEGVPCSDEEAERILGIKLAPQEPTRQNGTPPIQPGETWVLDAQGFHKVDEPPVELMLDGGPAPEDLPIVSSETTEPPHVRIVKPIAFPQGDEALDNVQTAIVEAKSQPVSASHTPAVGFNQKRTLAAIQQAYVGELTGSISGSVYCYGYAIHDGVMIYLNMGGPRMAVEAIRAKLSKGEIVNLIPWDAPAIELTAGEGNTGIYHDFMQNIPEAKFTSVIVIHDWPLHPNYGGKATTFIIRTDEAQAMAKLKHHVAELVKVPVFEDWAGYLYTAGQTAMLVRKTHSGGGIDLVTVDLDVEAWTRLIIGGIQQGIIALPSSS